MLKKPLFWEMFFLFAIVGILNWFAVTYNLFWYVREFDSLLHFLGGVFLSIFFLWFYFFSGLFASSKRDLKHFLIVSILGVVLVAVCWEIYELLTGEAEFGRSEYSFDTVLDFIMDLLGALAACFYGYMKEWHE